MSHLIAGIKLPSASNSPGGGTSSSEEEPVFSARGGGAGRAKKKEPAAAEAGSDGWSSSDNLMAWMAAEAERLNPPPKADPADEPEPDPELEPELPTEPYVPPRPGMSSSELAMAEAVERSEKEDDTKSHLPSWLRTSGVKILAHRIHTKSTVENIKGLQDEVKRLRESHKLFDETEWPAGTLWNRDGMRVEKGPVRLSSI